MAKVIFHPGIGKTGTSAIQSYAFDNMLDGQLKHDVVYCSIGITDKNVHNTFADNHPSFNLHKFDENIAALISEVRELNKDVLISSEFLIRSSAPHIRNMLEKLQKGNINVEVIVAVRNYEDYLISSYLQAVKVKWGMKMGETLKDYCIRELPNIRLPLLVDQWSRIIGDNKIKIFNYDKHKDSLIHSFLSAIGASNTIQPSSERVNSSIKLNQAAILLEFDKVCSNYEKRQALMSFLDSCHLNDSQEKRLKQQVKEIVRNQYTHDFERLSARYKVV